VAWRTRRPIPHHNGDEKEGELSVASSRDRQRKLAREKLDRQLARRAGRTRRRRRIQAGIGAAAALLLIIAGGMWLGGAFDSKPDDLAADGQPVCTWIPQSATDNSNLKDVGTPPTTGVPTTGSRPMTITTNQGAPITVKLDLAAAPCGAASLSYLAGRGFYDNTSCHEITTEGALRCGDPSGTGLGGPTYSFPTENAPDAPQPSAPPAPGTPALYPKGTVALIGTPPGSNGSQFLIFFKDFTPTTAPAYSIVGTVTGGLDVLTKISKLPTVDNGSGEKIKPKEQILVQSLTVGEIAGGVPPAPSGAASAAPTRSSQS
jgi:peptidyl-prolyl cis-trans isomerase B (cyclophilin B)